MPKRPRRWRLRERSRLVKRVPERAQAIAARALPRLAAWLPGRIELEVRELEVRELEVRELVRGREHL